MNSNIKKVEVAKLIVIIVKAGEGTEANPFYDEKQFYDFDGNLLFKLPS